MNFMCLDVETANENAGSICQIGIAQFVDGKHVPDLDFQSLVNPQDYFLPELTELHGISEADVKAAPTFTELHAALSDTLAGHVVLSHSCFDRVALRQASKRSGSSEPDCIWLDTVRVARRTWPERMHKEGHRLPDLADMCGIHLVHHSALSDATCAGNLFLRCCQETGLDLTGWLGRVRQPLRILEELQPNLDGRLAGEVIVFTGTLSRTRREIAELASSAGCEVDDNVTKHTTLVVVGVQDAQRLAGKDRSTKHRNALKWIAKGKPIRIITEADLNLLLAS